VTLIQAIGVVCALIAVVLLSREAEAAAALLAVKPVASGGE
jgi:hypothetical protein